MELHQIKYYKIRYIHNILIIDITTKRKFAILQPQFPPFYSNRSSSLANISLQSNPFYFPSISQQHISFPPSPPSFYRPSQISLQNYLLLRPLTPNSLLPPPSFYPSTIKYLFTLLSSPVTPITNQILRNIFIISFP